MNVSTNAGRESSSRTGRSLPVALVAATLAMGLLVMVGTEPAEAAFPGENGRIAFASNRVTSTNPEGDYEIFTVNPGGTGFTQLTNNRYDDFQPALSADGTRIVFVRPWEIYVMDADGTNRTRLTYSDWWVTNTRPTWSPDGTMIAFESTDTPDGRPKVFTMNSDGTEAKQLINDDFNDGSPAWSPDGTKIAFMRSTFCFGEQTLYGDAIFTAKPDGTNLTQLTDLCDGEDWSPEWSPDGSKIAFSQVGPLGDKDIQVIGANGNNQVPVIDNAGSAESPAWSPDGSKMAFLSDNTGGQGTDVFVVNVDGSGTQTNLTKNPTNGFSVDWGVNVPDTISPTVTAVRPTAGAAGVSRSTNAVATFSERMDPSTLVKANFKLYKVTATGPVQVTNVTVTPNWEGTRATLNPYGTSTTLLVRSTRYKAVVTTGVNDLAGNAMAKDKVWYFKTGG